MISKEQKKAYDKKRYEQKKEEILLKQKEYQEKNKEKIKQNTLKRKDEILEYNKKYYIENREYHLDYKKKYQKKDKYKEYQKRYKKERRKKDPLFNLTCRMRTIVTESLKRNKFTKKSKTQEIIGCEIPYLKTYIESKFETWMSWENYGKYNGELNYGWDIDHIIPLSSAKNEEELLKLFHYTNLQPLCSKINRDLKRNINN